VPGAVEILWGNSLSGCARLFVIVSVIAVGACGDDDATTSDAAPVIDAVQTLNDADLSSGWKKIAELPERVANNAVAAVQTASGCMLMSAFGIDFTREHTGIHSRVFTHMVGSDSWEQQSDVPGDDGLLAASAVSMRGKIYVLGGYSVAPNGAEASFADLNVFDPATEMWTTLAPMPVATDDAVAVAWRDRWIIVVSGWSDTAPIDNVQLYDADTNMWAPATAFPGSAVFGHAGTIVGDELMIIDGVRSAGIGGFADVNQTWHAQLDNNNPTQITWTDMGTHDAPVRYRAAAGTLGDLMLFHGGTDDPYNYDGLSYDSGTASAPEATTLIYDTASDQFTTVANSTKPTATMDHRGLVECGGALYTIGGMTSGPTVTADVWRYRP